MCMMTGVKRLIIGNFQHAGDLIPSVDMIYADPPFGTGKSFGWYHDAASVWRRDMDAALSTFDTLIAATGSIWIHVDDTDLGWLRTRCEAMSNVRYAATIAWERTYGGSNAGARTGITKTHDSILVLAGPQWRARPLPHHDDQDNLFIGWDGDAPWSSTDLSAPRADANTPMVYAIESPLTGKLHYPKNGRHWVYSPAAMAAHLAPWGSFEMRIIDDEARRATITAPSPAGSVPALIFTGTRQQVDKVQSGVLPTIMFGRTGRGGPRRKATRTSAPMPSDFWCHQDTGHVQQARADLEADIPGATFSTPKPKALLERIIGISTDAGDLVLDPFAGSGITGATAHRMGRDFVTAEISEHTAITVTAPRLQAALDGMNPYTTESLVTPLPYKTRRGEAERAATVLRQMASASRLDIDEQSLVRVVASLRAAEKTVTTSHAVPVQSLEVLTVPSVAPVHP